ncbi:Crp/Fnr family transcriptional regulator [Peptoniphilus sp.]|jgi:CRP-like cAMP-binding protein|uniref:Crp/Fnr family transcriptional regulator n=1 Tax=Peptoniphilus sp. TaxID=1971214 RepID=UPI003D90EAD1
MKVCNTCASKGGCINKIKLFKDLEMDDKDSLMLSAVHKDYEKNETIFTSNDLIEKIIIIRYGKIKTSLYDEDGKEYIGNILNEGDTIGEDSIFLEKTYETNGITIEKTGVCEIEKDAIKKVLLNNPSFSIKMIENLSKKLYQTNKQLEIMSIKDPYKRVASFLLQRSRLINKNTIELNQENIASSINMARETVSRKLSELERDGYIKLLAYKKIKIVNLPALIELAEI